MTKRVRYIGRDAVNPNFVTGREGELVEVSRDGGAIVVFDGDGFRSGCKMADLLPLYPAATVAEAVKRLEAYKARIEANNTYRGNVNQEGRLRAWTIDVAIGHILGESPR